MSTLASGALARAPAQIDPQPEPVSLPSSRMSGPSHHRRGASVQDLLTALGELPPPDKSRRPRSSTLSLGPISTLHLTTDPEDSPVSSPLRHSDPATRQLVQSLTRRSRTLADAVAKRRESRTTSASTSTSTITTTPPSEEQSPVEHLSTTPNPPISTTKRRTFTPAAPATPPSIPLPPIPQHQHINPAIPPPPSTATRPSTAPTPKAVTFGPVQHRQPDDADWSSDNDSVVWDALIDPARRRALAAARLSDTTDGSNSSTPINSPRAVLRNLQEPQKRTSPLNLDLHPGSTLAMPTRIETVCESSDEEMFEDELSEMEHGLTLVQREFNKGRRQSDPRRRGSQPPDSNASQPTRGLSRFETPDSTPTLNSEIFAPKSSQALLEVPGTDSDQANGVVRDPSRDSVSTTTSDFTAASFDLRSRGNSISTGASSINATQMQRSTSTGSSITSNARSKDATIPARTDSLAVATPPVRMASLENLRPHEPILVHQPVQVSAEPASSLLGLSMKAFDSEGAGPSQNFHPPRKPALLGAWLDESLAKKMPNRPRQAGTLGWPDEGDSDESDGQRFVPRPIHGARKRLNSADSSIFSYADSEMTSPPEADWQGPTAPDSHHFAPPLLERKSKSVSHTPTISPTFKPLLLPSESISRSHYRAANSRNMEMRSPYAGLQARSQAKLGINDIRLLPPTPQLEQLPYSSSSHQFSSHASSQLPSALALRDAARYDPDNQSVSSLGFSHAPTPPITPSRPTYPTASEEPLSKARSPGMSNGSMSRNGIFGRNSNPSAPGPSSQRISEFGQMPMSAASEGVAPDAQAPYAAGVVASDPSGRLTPNWDSLDGQRSNSASIRMGKLRTTIFDSFGVKREKERAGAESYASERPQSPTDSAASHHGNEHGSGLLTSLIRRASTTSHHPNAPPSSMTSSFDSSNKLYTHQKHLLATMSTASSPAKKGGKLPTLDRTTTSESHASSSRRRERIPSADSQTDLHTVSSSSRTKYSSQASTKSSLPSSSAHGLVSSSSSSNRTGSQLSSPAIGGPERRRSETGTSTSSVRSGGSSQGGKSTRTDAAASTKPRPTRKEDVVKVNNVLAELQAAGFMAPPKKKKTAASSSHPVSFRSSTSKGSGKNSVQSR